MSPLSRLGVLGNLLATALLTLWAALTLPDRVPVHFAPDGTPDRWGSRVEILLVGFVALLAVGGLGVLARGIGRSWSLALVNLPGKQRWLPDHERALRERLATDLAVLAAAIGLLLNGLYAGAVAAGAAQGPLPGWSLALAVLGLLMLAAWTIAVSAVRYRRPPTTL